MGLPYLVNRRLGRRIFKNKSGVIGNLSGELNKAVCRSLTEGEKKLDVTRKGFRELEDADRQKVEALRKKFEDKIKEDKISKVELGEDREVIKQHNSKQNFFEIGDFPEIIDICNSYKEQIKDYFGSGFKPIYVNFMRYPEIEEGDVSTRSWHMDEYSPDHIRLFILLSEASENNGSSCFLPEDESIRAVKSQKKNFTRDTGFWDKFDKNHFAGEPGKVALADPVNFFHRGTNPDGHRDIAIVTFRPSPHEYDESWDELQNIEGETSMMHLSSLLDTSEA